MTAGIPYTVNTGDTLVNETFGPNNIRRRRRTGKHELRPMPIRDGRARYRPGRSCAPPVRELVPQAQTTRCEFVPQSRKKSLPPSTC
jgi:hypothetical protein